MATTTAAAIRHMWLDWPLAVFRLVPEINFSPSVTSCECEFYALCRAGRFSVAAFLLLSKH